jgi:hypothetical protein
MRTLPAAALASCLNTDTEYRLLCLCPDLTPESDACGYECWLGACVIACARSLQRGEACSQQPVPGVWTASPERMHERKMRWLQTQVDSVVHPRYPLPRIRHSRGIRYKGGPCPAAYVRRTMEEGEAVAAATLAAAAGTRAEGARNTPALKVVADMKKVDATAAVVVEGDADCNNLLCCAHACLRRCMQGVSWQRQRLPRPSGVLVVKPPKAHA